MTSAVMRFESSDRRLRRGRVEEDVEGLDPVRFDLDDISLRRGWRPIGRPHPPAQPPKPMVANGRAVGSKHEIWRKAAQEPLHHADDLSVAPEDVSGFIDDSVRRVQLDDRRHTLLSTEALRGLVDAIVLTPDQAREALQIELRGNLAAMLGATVQTKRSSESDDLSLQVSLVAGACNQRYLQLWSGAA